MFKKLLKDATDEIKKENLPSIKHTTSRPHSSHIPRNSKPPKPDPKTQSIEEHILNKVKDWWNDTKKTHDDIDTFLNNKTTIDGYTFHVSSGHQANIFAKKNGESIHIMGAGQPATREEFNAEVMRQLNRKNGGNKKKKNKSKTEKRKL